MEKYLEIIIRGLAIALFLAASGMEGFLWDSAEQTDGAKSAALESSREEKELEDAVTVFERLLAENAGSISSYEVDCLRAGAVEAENQDAWLGEWSRTYVERGCGACMQVSETEEGGCHVMLEAAYYSHNGGASGELCFLDAERAFVPVWEEEWDWTGECAILLLSMENDILTVRSLGADYGCGVGVTLGGTYTQGEAVYTNENVLSETFTEEEQKRIRVFLEGMGYSYEEEFVFPVEYGYGDTYRIIGEFADGEQVAGEWYEWNFPTMGSENFTLFLSDDGYSYWYKWGTGYLTDDPERGEAMQGPKTGRREDEVFFPVITGGEMTEEPGDVR